MNNKIYEILAKINKKSGTSTILVTAFTIENTMKSAVFVGTPGRNRTCDTRIRNPGLLLYIVPLSHNIFRVFRKQGTFLGTNDMNTAFLWLCSFL